MRGKIGLAIATCNRRDFCKTALGSIPLSRVDEIVLVNDGEPYEEQGGYGIDVIQHRKNMGVAVSKNDGIRHLMARGCDHIFVMEDDMLIIDEEIFDIYVRAASESGLGHFNYGPGFAFNRQQQPGLGLHNQHLANYTAPLLKKLIVEYAPEAGVCFFPNLGGMFAYFSRDCIANVGLMDEGFMNVFEHVEHTYRISKTRFHPPFWWFADVNNSEHLIVSQEGSMEWSSISKRKSEIDPEWQHRFFEGTQYFKKKTGYLPAEIPKASRDDVVNFLMTVRPKLAQ